MIVTRMSLDAGRDELEGWPFELPVVAQLRPGGLRFDRPVTFLVGENGTGKSTLIEALASAYGMDVRGGHGGRRYAIAPGGHGDGLLSDRLRLDLTPTGARARDAGARGFFLRAETAHGVLGAMSDAEVPGYGERHLHKRSHGESFLDVVTGRFSDLGLYLLDEPESALSFQSCLALLHVLAQLPATGSQVICATHSPVLTALPGAQIIELTGAGFSPVAWADLAMVQHWRAFLDDPSMYLRHLVET